jgi:hypothetical protein
MSAGVTYKTLHVQLNMDLVSCTLLLPRSPITIDHFYFEG